MRTRSLVRVAVRFCLLRPDTHGAWEPAPHGSGITEEVAGCVTPAPVASMRDAISEGGQQLAEEKDFGEQLVQDSMQRSIHER